MQVSSLKRNPKVVIDCLKELPDGRLVALKPVKIVVPARYADRGLAEIGVDTYIYGIYAMIVDDLYYGVSIINANMRIEPFSNMIIKMDGVDYYEFSFRAGDTVFSSVNLVQQDTLIYRVYEEFISKGNIPWFMSYLDLGLLFSSAKKHAGTSVGENVEVTELLISLIARDVNNKVDYYRTKIDTMDYLKTNPPFIIPLKSVIYAATNTTNKIAGSYMGDGVVSALVNPSSRQERLENLLLQ